MTSQVDIEQWLADEVQIVFAEQEGAAFVNGDGSNKPKGFLHYTNVADASWSWGSIGYVASGTDGDFAASVPADALLNLPLVGINTSADTTNRLAVKSAALLFDNAGAGVQAKLNKHAAGDTASLLYQDNYSGRAEIGLCGDDNLHLKISADGSSFAEALVIDGAGRVMLNGQTQPYAVTSNTSTVTPTLQLAGLGADASILFARFSAGGNPARFTFACSRGATRGDFTSVADGNILGRFSFNGADGTAFREAAWISAHCDQAPSAGNVPGKIAFGTMSPGGTVALDRMCIFNDGNVFIGTGVTTRPVCKLDVDGPVRVKSYVVAALPAAAGAGQMILVSDESGGAVLAFSDGTAWRRVTDRAVVS